MRSWTVVGTRCDVSGDADALAVLAGVHTAAFVGGTDETSGWVRVVEAEDWRAAVRVAECEAQLPVRA
ncbi:hypothetical protein CTZ27_03080 [Streptomyces griseocarneus]|nr:hypothetical protein CTZ27_03080 [Streptomyces griseocarneus]